MSGRLTQYDKRQLRLARHRLAAALYQCDLALDPERIDPDRRFRCMFAASYAVQATTLLDQADRRLLRRGAAS